MSEDFCFYACSQNREKRLLDSSYLFVSLSVRHSARLSALMEQLGSHLVDFHEIWYFSIFFLKYDTKIQISLKYDKKGGTIHEYLCTIMIISRSYLLIMRNASDRSCTKHTSFPIIFFAENRAVYEVMWKNMVQPARWQITIYYGACAWHAG
jgi:hypothetical protein